MSNKIKPIHPLPLYNLNSGKQIYIFDFRPTARKALTYSPVVSE